MYTEDLVSAVDAGNPVIPEKKRASRHTGPDRQEAENILDEAEREAQGKDGQQQSGKQEPARHRDVFEEEEEYEPVSKRRPEPRTRAKQQRDTDYEYEDPYEEDHDETMRAVMTPGITGIWIPGLIAGKKAAVRPE